MKPKPFRTEADLCAGFLAWVANAHPQLRCYAEWAGWDILVVYPEGQQLGIQAKLRLNADVILQAAPGAYERQLGPDFRAVLVPETNGLSEIAHRLGLVVLTPILPWWERDGGWKFSPDIDRTADRVGDWNWLDWNPRERHELPPTITDAIAGSPCPVSLTPWKLGALDVLAELAAKGAITTKRIRALGVNPSRWLSARWLVPGVDRGVWVRGDDCPKFDEQHPTAYAHAMEKARGTSTVQRL